MICVALLLLLGLGLALSECKQWWSCDLHVGLQPYMYALYIAPCNFPTRMLCHSYLGITKQTSLRTSRKRSENCYSNVLHVWNSNNCSPFFIEGSWIVWQHGWINCGRAEVETKH